MPELMDAGSLLCHYTRAEIAFEHVLPSGQLRMSPYSLMRDPFENKRPYFLSAGAWGEQDEAQDRMLWALQEEVSQARDPFLLLSFTQWSERAALERAYGREDVFHCPWARPRMWEQYSDTHAGACLVFDRTRLLATLHDQLADRGTYWSEAVEYTVAGFGTAQGAHISLGDFHEASLAADVRRHVMNHYRDFFFLKTTDWATEYEYRVVWEPAEDGPLSDPPFHHVSYDDSLLWVIVGEKFPEWQLPAARAVTERAEAELRSMTWELNLPYAAKAKAAR